MAYDISSWNKPAGPATNRDLDRRAMRLLPDWAKEAVREVATRHDVPIHVIFSKAKSLQAVRIDLQLSVPRRQRQMHERPMGDSTERRRSNEQFRPDRNRDADAQPYPEGDPRVGGNDDNAMWLPVSQIQTRSKGGARMIVTMPKWLAAKEGLI
jgi:hypothetical protein